MKHGTVVGYTKGGCRCEACSTAQCRYVKKWRVDREAGIERTVPTDAIRAHVEQLLAGGMSFRAIALSAGWKSRNSLTSALSRRRVRVATHERIMAISPESDTRRFGYVDSTGSRRRLQALVVMGWSTRELAVRMGGRDHGTVTDITSANNATIRRETAERIAAIYDELWDSPGPSRVSTQRALRRGWVPPLAWDDDAIDDPSAKPHGAGWTPRKRDRDALLEDVAELQAQGLTLPAIASRLGMTEVALERALYRAKADGIDIDASRRTA